MFTKIKKWFKKKKKEFSKWKTSKTTLFMAIWACIIYTVVNCLYSILNTNLGMVFSFDPTLTSEWFEFWKWVVISGGTLSIVKVVKQPKKEVNEDEDFDRTDS